MLCSEDRFVSAPRDELTDDDLKLAAARKVVVIPTAQLGRFEASEYSPDGTSKLDPARFGRIVERQKRLFERMLARGVTLALGSDAFGRPLGGELAHFHENRILDNRTLLRTATETTARMIFPNRKIGRLQEGFEASFFVLSGDPLADFARQGHSPALQAGLSPRVAGRQLKIEEAGARQPFPTGNWAEMSFPF